MLIGCQVSAERGWLLCEYSTCASPGLVPAFRSVSVASSDQYSHQPAVWEGTYDPSVCLRRLEGLRKRIRTSTVFRKPDGVRIECIFWTSGSEPASLHYVLAANGKTLSVSQWGWGRSSWITRPAPLAGHPYFQHSLWTLDFSKKIKCSVCRRSSDGPRITQ